MKKTLVRVLSGGAVTTAALGLAASQALASGGTWTISPANTAYSASLSGSAVMTSGSASITCTGSTVNGTTGSSPVTASPAPLASIGTGSFSGCRDSIANGSWTVSMSGGELEGVSFSNGVSTGEITGITAKASGSDLGLSCSFTATGSVPSGDATFTNPGTLKITGASLTLSGVSGSACGLAGLSNGKTATFKATYTVTSPSGGITVTDP